MNRINAFILTIAEIFMVLFGISTVDRIVTKKVVFDVECRSDICCPGEEVWDNGAQYPTVIELNHNGDNNGTLIATNEVFDKGETKFRIMKSPDHGENWTEISVVTETMTEGLMTAWEPCLFELPAKVGNYPEGTVVLGEISLDDGCKSKTQLSLFVSTDCGKNWNEISVIDTAGGLDDGIWEPFFVYENGYVYCFYSDDSDAVCSQTIVYKRSSDLINWSEKVPVVKSSDPDDRPGMPVLAKMGNGSYYLIYEYGGKDNYPMRYKVSESISEWNSSDSGTEIFTEKGCDIHTSPCCLWIPQGGKNGALIVGGKYGSAGNNELFVSFDYGKTYSLMDNPLPYSDKKGFGYSSSLFYSEKNDIIYYACAVDYKSDFSKISFARIRPEGRFDRIFLKGLKNEFK